MTSRWKLAVLLCAWTCSALCMATFFTWTADVNRHWDEPGNWDSNEPNGYPNDVDDFAWFGSRSPGAGSWAVGLVDATIYQCEALWSVAFDRQGSNTPVLTLTEMFIVNNRDGSADLELTISNARIVVEGGL